MTEDRVAALIALVISLALAVSLVELNITSSQALRQKDSTISTLQDQVASDNTTINSLNSQIEKLQDQVKSANNQISLLNSTVATLQAQVNGLTAVINMSKSSALQTLVFHVSEKGQGYTWGHLPNVTYTYNQILALNKGKYNVMLLPEYMGNANWAATFGWLKQSFSTIPIMLPVFEGGSGNNPLMMLTVDQLSEAVSALNVRSLRISEMVSWYIQHLQPFPTDYVKSVLDFARVHNLMVEWSEWKVNGNVFQTIQNFTSGYENIVTVTFQTNSNEAEPAGGFELVSSLFRHWGGSVQSWYWETRGLGSEFDMPASLLVQHALEAKNMGAEILQFEPYWYFFDNGQPNANFSLLMAMLT